MASSASTPAFAVVHIIGYALLASLVSYFIIRLGRHLASRLNRDTNQTRLPTSLPKSTKTASSQDLVAGISTGWNWRKWRSSLSFPRVPYWSKVPDAVVGKAKAVATAKNLSVELLPTTGLPPPPSSIPSAQLVDLTTPTPTRPTTPYAPLTPALTTGATSNSFPSSPRTPSPSPFGHFNVSKAIFYPAPPHPSYPRSPSPHALLATTPPQKQSHRRSRSLGGVPVRRLSGNSSSGLRNAIEMDVEMKDVKTYSGHLRGTSQEHLLIDFSSSSSSDEDETKVSPAASDIGVLSANSGQVNPPMVGRHVPLVDLSDAEDDLSASNRFQGKTTDDASWRWFGSGNPSSSYGSMRHFTDVQSKEKQVFSRVEKLIDIDTTDSHPEQALGLRSNVNIEVRRVELDLAQREQLLIDVSDNEPKRGIATTLYRQMDTKASEDPLVDLRDDAVGKLVDVEEQFSFPKPQLQIPPLPSQATVLTTPVLVRTSFSQPHPLENLAHVTTQLMVPQSATSVALTPIMKGDKVYAQVADEPSLLFPGLQSKNIAGSDDEHSKSATLVDVSPDDESVFEYPVAEQRLSEVSSPLSPLHVGAEVNKPIEVDSMLVETAATTQDGWSESWDEVDIEDPWGSHVPEPEALEPEVSTPDSEVFVYTGVDAVLSVIEPEYPQETSGEQFTMVEIEEHGTVLEDLEVLDKSPGGTLFATVLPDSDDNDIEGGVPVLSLDSEVETGLESDKAETNALPLQDGEGDEEEDITPKPTPGSMQLELPETSTDTSSGDVLVIVVEEEGAPESECPDPELLPLPESPLVVSTQSIPVIAAGKKDEQEKLSPSQTPTPPASPPISPLRFVMPSSAARLPSPRLVIAPSLPRLQDFEDKENQTPIAVKATEDSRSLLSATSTNSDGLPSPGLRRRVLAPINANENEEPEVKKEVSPITIPKVEVEEGKESGPIAAPELKLSTSLPGSFPEPSVVSAVSSATPSTTIAARLALTSDAIVPRPSARAIVRSPVDIALAMQLRPGLGAGADPAWMVRFLMAMFGWLAVVVSQGGEY